MAPTLRAGDVVVLDNLSAHKVKGMRATIEAAAQLRYLPPIARTSTRSSIAFAKVKALLRAVATRTVEALWHALDAFTPAECAHYLAHAGYVPSNRETL